MENKKLKIGKFCPAAKSTPITEKEKQKLPATQRSTMDFKNCNWFFFVLNEYIICAGVYGQSFHFLCDGKTHQITFSQKHFPSTNSFCEMLYWLNYAAQSNYASRVQNRRRIATQKLHIFGLVWFEKKSKQNRKHTELFWERKGELSWSEKIIN